MRKRWEVFIYDCLLLMDGDGTFRHWKYDGAYANQPWVDMNIYRVIRGRWVELKNKDMQQRAGSLKKPGGLRGIRRYPVKRRR